MANHGQHPQGNSARKRGGAGQAVVELCAIAKGSLVFWSRQRYEIGSELQIRVLRDAIPTSMSSQMPEGEWVTLKGYVIECPAVRRPGGEHGFEVSLLMESALDAGNEVPVKRGTKPFPKMKSMFPGLKRVGLN